MSNKAKYISEHLPAEVTVPVSMKEVGGYIQKQVAFLSGESWTQTRAYKTWNTEKWLFVFVS